MIAYFYSEKEGRSWE